MKKETFFEDVEKRFAQADTRLYPECDSNECVKMDDLKLRGRLGEGYREIQSINKSIETIQERLKLKKLLHVFIQNQKE